jgi:hypothetical protein
VPSRVARWFIYRPKIPIWVNFGGFRLENVGIFWGILNILKHIWDIL